MGNDFENNGCGYLEIVSEYHPLAQALFDAYKSVGQFLTPQIRAAFDNIVKSSRQWQHPEVITGETQIDSWIGKKVIMAFASNYVVEPESGAYTFNSVTGTFTPSVEYLNYPFVLLMGYDIDSAVEDYEING